MKTLTYEAILTWLEQFREDYPVGITGSAEQCLVAHYLECAAVAGGFYYVQAPQYGKSRYSQFPLGNELSELAHEFDKLHAPDEIFTVITADTAISLVKNLMEDAHG